MPQTEAGQGKKNGCLCQRRLRRTGRSHPSRSPGCNNEAGEGGERVEFLIDTGATYSVLNKALVPVGRDCVMAQGATGQSEKA